MLANTYIARAVRVVDKMDIERERVPLLIMSHPGFGKTSTIRMYCDYYDYNLVTVIASQYSSDDLLGLQSVQNGELVRLTPSWYNRMVELMKNGRRTILLLDEISAVDPYIQGPLFDLIFSRSLGEEHLPDNVFIVAAGNYSCDLDNTFKMSSPLVNRFLILNLTNDDFDIDELTGDSEKAFDSYKRVPGNQAISDYLSLEEEDPKFDFERFKKWVNVSREVGFEKTTYEEDPAHGLVGFTSIRSLSYALKFAKAYVTSYNDKLWLRIVGDTLGMSVKREGKFLRDVLEVKADDFLINPEPVVNSFSKCCEDFLNSPYRITVQDMEHLRELFLEIDKSEITMKDVSNVEALKGKCKADPKIQDFLDSMCNALKTAVISVTNNNHTGSLASRRYSFKQ